MTILEQAAGHFKSARRDILAGAVLLHRIASESLYKPRHETFGEYVTQECDIGVSFASKLISVVKTYMVEGGLKKQELEGVDVERLYLAIRTRGSLAAKLERARLLTRGDLKQELRDDEHPDCTHEESFTICAKCHKRITP